MTEACLGLMAEVILEHRGGREIWIRGNGKKAAGLQKKLLSQGCDAAAGMGEIFRQLENQKYAVVMGRLPEKERTKLQQAGYRETEDYLTECFPPIVVKGRKDYEDGYKNRLINVPGNLTVTVKGYGNVIEFGDGVKMGKNSRLAVENGGRVKIGGGCRFGPGTRMVIWDKGKITIGSDCTFGENCKFAIGLGAEFFMGNDCMTSLDVVFRVGDGHAIFDAVSGERMNLPYEQDGMVLAEICKIGNHVWVGEQAYVLQSLIGDHCIIGARSLLKGKYAGKTIWGGSTGKAA